MNDEELHNLLDVYFNNMCERVNEYDKMDRTSKDLDSIERGVPSKAGKIKLYFNSREDKIEDLEARVELTLSLLNYVNTKLGGLE